MATGISVPQLRLVTKKRGCQLLMGANGGVASEGENVCVCQAREMWRKSEEGKIARLLC